MIYDWYNIVNSDDFEALGLPSKTYTFILEDVGQKDILVTKGIAVGIIYEDVFLSVNLNNRNPFAMDGYAVYKDANHDIWLGIEVQS